MSRKGFTPTRTKLPDPKHGSEMVARFINMVMKSGKKSVAEKIAMAYHAKRRKPGAELTEAELGSFGTGAGVTFAEPLAEESSSDDT